MARRATRLTVIASVTCAAVLSLSACTSSPGTYSINESKKALMLEFWKPSDNEKASAMPASLLLSATLDDFEPGGTSPKMTSASFYRSNAGELFCGNDGSMGGVPIGLAYLDKGKAKSRSTVQGWVSTEVSSDPNQLYEYGRQLVRAFPTVAAAQQFASILPALMKGCKTFRSTVVKESNAYAVNLVSRGSRWQDGWAWEGNVVWAYQIDQSDSPNSKWTNSAAQIIKDEQARLATMGG